MRRSSHLVCALAALTCAAAPAFGALAQSQRDDDAHRKAQSDQDAKKKQKDKDWKVTQAPLPDQKNAGPCPYVKVLYDASRYVEIKDDKELSQNVGWTGEIQNLSAQCAYKANDPIRVSLRVNFGFGRGPQAQGDTKTYRYWVAVTKRNADVLAKQDFELPVQFAPGQDRLMTSDRVADIIIPRADNKVSGTNFEILVGFDVTPKQAEFNRVGKRFKLNSGAAATEVASKQ